MTQPETIMDSVQRQHVSQTSDKFIFLILAAQLKFYLAKQFAHMSWKVTLVGYNIVCAPSILVVDAPGDSHS